MELAEVLDHCAHAHVLTDPGVSPMKRRVYAGAV